MPKQEQKKINLQERLNAIRPEKNRSKIKRGGGLTRTELKAKQSLSKTGKMAENDFVLYVIETFGASIGFGLIFWLIVFELIKHF